MSDKLREALEPCPFCGGEGAEVSFYMRGSSKEPAGYYVECVSCTAAGAHMDIHGEMPDRVEYTKSKAIAAWNTRAALTADQAPTRMPGRERIAETLWDHFRGEQLEDDLVSWDHLPDKAQWLDRADAILDLLTAQPDSGDGWALVPREPTEAMLRAGCAAIEDTDLSDDDDVRWWAQQWEPCALSAWSAMLAATPSQPDEVQPRTEGRE